MPNPDLRRSRASRKLAVEIVPEATPEQVNEKAVQEIRASLAAVSSEPLKNVEVIQHAHTDVKASLQRFLAHEASHSKAGAKYAGQNPLEVVERFKARVSNLNERLELIKKKAKANSRLQDLMLMKDDVKLFAEAHLKPTVFSTAANAAKHEAVMGLLEDAFKPGTKVTLELLPFARPQDHVDKEQGLADALAARLCQLEKARAGQTYTFFRDGISVPDALQFVRRVFERLAAPAALKEAMAKVDRNLAAIESLKNAASTEDKLADEERSTLAKIGEVWQFFSYLLEQQRVVNNGVIFFNVMASVQKQLQGFGEEMAQFDRASQSLASQSKAVTEKLEQQQAKLKATFFGEIHRELADIEQKARALTK